MPEKTGAIYIESLCLQSAIWHPAATGLDPRGSQLSKAALCTRDDLAWENWHDLRVLFEIALEEGKASNPTVPPKIASIGHQPPVDIVTPLYRRLLRAVDDAVNALDSGGLPAIRKVLKQAYKKFEGQADRIRSVLTGHAHIDLVWLWPERTGEYKATHTFSTMNRLMDIYPDFVFGYSQPASYDAVKRISPRLMDQVRKRIASGKWEPLGATEVESDTLMACGEALARSFLLGQKGFQRLQGKPSRVLWIPDVFGYCGSLPQIMRQTGVDYFFTTKLTWSSINLFPYSSFVWRGIDDIRSAQFTSPRKTVTTSNVSPEEIRRGARLIVNPTCMTEYSLADWLRRRRRRCDRRKCANARGGSRRSPECPKKSAGAARTSFDKLNLVRAKLPSWQGELYLEYHRGVLTTHSDLKARFREYERALRVWEAARCATGGGELDDQPWRRLVFAQFHGRTSPAARSGRFMQKTMPELSSISGNALGSATKGTGKGERPRSSLPIGASIEHL